MLLSSYNIILQETPETVVLFNSRSGAICEIERSVYDLYMANRSAIQDTFPFFNDFQELGFVTSLCTNEAIVDDSDTCTFVISLSERCNLSCYYCFEKNAASSVVAEKELLSSLLSVFERQLALKPSIRALHVIWFGGEPLLKKEEIALLSKRFIHICNEHKIQYNASMVTNGTLFSQDFINDLGQYRIGDIQITIDGGFDKFRENKQGNKSLWENLCQSLFALHTKCHVTLRINLDKQNLSSVKAYLFTLKQEHVLDALAISIARIDIDNDIRGLSYDEFCHMKLDLIDYLIYELHSDNDESVFKELTPIDRVCAIRDAGAIVVDSQGYCYKCEDWIGKNSRITIDDTENCFSLINQSCLPKREGCLSCSIYPLCKGGCPTHWNMSNCESKRKYIKDLALVKYKYRTASDAM